MQIINASLIIYGGHTQYKTIITALIEIEGNVKVQ